MITAADLKSRTVKDLATMAKKKKVLGWHAMRKDELVQVLVKLAKSENGKQNGSMARPKNGSAVKNGAVGKNGVAVKNGAVGKNGVVGKNGIAVKNGAVGKNGCVVKNGATVKNGAVPKNAAAHSNGSPANGHVVPKPKMTRTSQTEARLQQIKTRLAEAKDLSIRSVERDSVGAKDRLIVMVRDPYWLHAYWELSRRSIERAQAAMGQFWHAARPVLRLNEVARNGTTSAARKALRDIEIHGGVNNWYIDVNNPPKSYQLEIGYAEPGGRFYSLARSNIVSTPAVGTADNFDRNWSEVAKEFDRVYAMTAGSTEQEANGDLKEVLEEQLHRPMGESLSGQFGPGACALGMKREFPFHIDTELIVHGTTHPDARVTLRGEPVRLREDGTFAVRFNLPDRRHVLPVVASSCDGAEQRTIVLAVDRNTKVMEPVIRDHGE